METQETAKEDLPQEHRQTIGGPMSSVLTYRESYISSIVRKFPNSRELDSVQLQSDDFRSVCEKIRVIEKPFTPEVGGKNTTSVSENYEIWEKNIEGCDEMTFVVTYRDDVFHITKDEELVGFCKKESDGALRWVERNGMVLLINRKRFEFMKTTKDKVYQSVYPIIVVSPPDDVKGNVLPTFKHVGGLALNKIAKPQEKPLEKPREEEKKELIPAGV